MSASRASFVVRVANPDDVDAAGSVVAAAYLHDLQVSARYLERLRDAESRAAQAVLLVAVDDERVLGSITYVAGGTSMAQLASPGEVELRMLGVDPAARARGVAGCLVRACVDRARDEQHGRVVLSTQPEMAAAQRLYQRLGFVRQPDLDWVPEPGVVLIGYALTL